MAIALHLFENCSVGIVSQSTLQSLVVCEDLNGYRNNIMLGEKIGEMSGKISSQRVLSIADGRLQMETSMQGKGTLLGANVKETGTYIAIFLADGTQYGEGRGFMTTADGEIATWRGHGVGKANKDGAASYRGSLIFQTMPAQLSGLNNVAVIFEYTVDVEGNTHSEYWQWK